MPMMLDSHMDGMGDELPHVDLGVDLFGDDVLAITPRPPSKQLLKRMDELRTRGCCRSMAWSKQGTVASISADGFSLDFRCLRVNPSDAVWDLSEPTPYEVSGLLPNGPIVHLVWSTATFPELAVIDAFGRVLILTFPMTVNRPYETRSWKNDAADDLHSVVGCYWLPMAPPRQQYLPIYGPAVKVGENWEYKNGFTHPHGPWHPNQAKCALVCVTANGFLKLIYAQNNNKMEETQLELESITSSDDLVTHASICSDKGNLLIVLATASKQMKVIQVALNWNMPPDKPSVPPGSVRLSPTLKENHIAVTSWLQHDTTESHLDASMAHLSHLEVLSPVIGNVNNVRTMLPATILTARSHIPTTQSPYHLELQSIIDRWEVVMDQPQTLHPAFEQLGSRNGMGSPPANMTRLRKVESTIFHKIIISITTVQAGKVICIAFSDGTVQYRDRSTMAETYNEINHSEVMTLHQVGFHFAEERPSLQVAFSPTNSSFAHLCEDGKIKWNGLRCSVQPAESSTNDPEYAAIIAGLTVVTSNAVYAGMNHDDVLAAAQPLSRTHRDFARAWIMSLHRVLKFNVDYSEEVNPDLLVRNVQLQFCLSLMNHLDFRGEFQPKLFNGKFAVLFLNVRNIFILIVMTSNVPQKQQVLPFDEPDVVDALASCVKWSLDFFAWLTDSLFNLLDNSKFMELLSSGRFLEMNAYLRSKNDVSLHLVLCSSMRGFISNLCRRILHLENMSKHYVSKMSMQNATDPNGNSNHQATPLHQAYVKMQQYTANSLVKVQEFERLILILGADIKQTYQQRFAQLQAQAAQQNQQPGKPGPSPEHIKRAQGLGELHMLMGSSPQADFRHALLKFFNTDLAAFRGITDPAPLFFADFDLLEVEDDLKLLAGRKAQGKHVDVFRRAEIVRGPDAQWRRCVRCAAVMEDVSGPRYQKPAFQFVVNQQRRCSCSGNWAMLPVGALVT